MNREQIQQKIKVLIRPGDSMGSLQAKIEGTNQFKFLDALNDLVKRGLVVCERTPDGYRYKWRDQ